MRVAASLLLAALPLAAAQKKCYVDLDLLFVLDGSLSIKKKSWATDLDATRTIANNFTFGCTHVENQQDAEMGLIQFSDKVRVEQHLTCDRDAFLSSVSSMTQMKDYTYTGDALEAASNEFAQNGRSTSTKVVVMITDGVPCTNVTHDTCYDKAPVPTPDPAQAAKAKQFASQMKGAGVVFITIAVGKFGTEGMAFIDDVSSAPASKYVFNPSSWAKLPELIDEIVTDICPTPAPTPAPTLPPKCSVDLDVLFLLDASKSIKQDAWQIDLSASQQIASAFAFGCKDDPKVGGAAAEMGIIEFATSTTTAQPLTCDKDAFLSTVQGLKQPCPSGDASCHGWTYTGDALEQAHTVFNTTGRPSGVKLAIIITDGVPCTPDSPMSGTGTCRSIIPDPVPDKAQAGKALQWATTLKGEGATIVTIAVGDFGTNGIQFVNSISSTPASRYVFNPSSWKDLTNLIQDILDSICPPQA